MPIDSFGSFSSPTNKGGSDPKRNQDARAGTLAGGADGLSPVDAADAKNMSVERPLPSDAANHPNDGAGPGPTPDLNGPNVGNARYPVLPVVTGSGSITPVTAPVGRPV